MAKIRIPKTTIRKTRSLKPSTRKKGGCNCGKKK